MKNIGVRRIIITLASLILVVVLAIIGYLIWSFAHGASVENGQIIGAPKGYQLSHPFAEHEAPTRNGVIDPLATEGERVYPQADGENGQAMPPVDENGDTYAPMPEHEFHNSQCDGTPRREVTALPGDTWTLPSQTSVQAPIIPAASTANLPDAPAALRQADTGTVDQEHGRVIEGGHVNYPLNSSAPGALSPFGYLHRAHACDSVYQSDASGHVHEFQIVSMYTVPQDQTKNDAVYTQTPDEHDPMELAMITCAGRYVGDDGTSAPGGTLYYNGFRYNLIVIAKKVS